MSTARTSPASTIRWRQSGSGRAIVPHNQTTRAAFGDVARTADFGSFLAVRTVGGPRNDIAAFAGARLMVSVEVEDGCTLAAALVRIITGGDTITARRLHQESFEFRPCLRLWLVCNHAPRAGDDNPALWRRVCRAPVDVTNPEAEQDLTLKARFRWPDQLSAVLAWAVEGDFAAPNLELPSDIQEVVRFLRLTGWRCTQALGLTWDQVDMGGGIIRLATADAKGGDARLFPFGLAPEIVRLIEPGGRLAMACWCSTEMAGPSAEARCVGRGRTRAGRPGWKGRSYRIFCVAPPSRSAGGCLRG